MKGTFEVTATVSNTENANKIAKLMQNILDKVDEKDLLNLSEKIEQNPNYFRKAVQTLNKPFVQKMFR